MRGIVYNNGIKAGTLERWEGGGYIFRYDDDYFTGKSNPPISLTLPKIKQEYRSEKMFAFFYGLLSEGVNKDIQCRLYQIDEKDDFKRLLLTAGHDTIGAITIKQEENAM